MSIEILAMILTGIECTLIAGMPGGSFNDGVVARGFRRSRHNHGAVASLSARALCSQLVDVIEVHKLEIRQVSFGISSHSPMLGKIPPCRFGVRSLN